GDYLVGTAVFGPPLTSSGVTGQLMPITATSASDPGGCNPLTGANALAANGNIVLIDRGVCSFVTKVKNAQNAGAKGVVIAENGTNSPPSGLGGSDPTITIPSVMITQADGNTLKNALRFRSRTRSGVNATLDLNMSQIAGADAGGRALLFTPNPFIVGSSVSHWDTIATPNQLMEPFLNADLTHEVIPPEDLTLPLLKDIGWP
ncbi:MAG: PA domain-containing protein, partial [Candidatus Deferrimicrobiaceae bacterium]